MELSKSLVALEEEAEQLLKSTAAEEKQEEEVAPEEIAEDSGTPNTEDAEDNSDAEENGTDDAEADNVKKSCDDDMDLQKSDDADSDEESAEDEVEKSEDTEEIADENEEETAEDIEKSLRDEFEASTEVRQGVEESEFLSAVVDVLTKSMSDVQYDVLEQGRANQKSVDILAKSLQVSLAANKELKAENEKLARRITKLEKSISRGFEQIMDSLDEMSTQPVGMRKSLASVTVHDRDFAKSMGGVPVKTGFESLSKSQVLTVLNNELYAGNQAVTAGDIIGYESGAPLRTDLQRLVESKLQ